MSLFSCNNYLSCYNSGMEIICKGPCGRSLEHTEENFHIQRRAGQPDKLRIRCKQCHALAVKAWQKDNLDHYEKYQKGWVKENKAANPEKWRERQFRQDCKKMGVTPEWYNETFQKQNGCCAICYLPETQIHPATKEIARLAIDHNHTCCPGDKSCGKCIRGLLCAKCNQALHKAEAVVGWFSKAFNYLQNHPLVP